MSEQYDSFTIMNEALEDVGPLMSLHDFTKAILAVLDRHGFLNIVDKEGDDE